MTYDVLIPVAPNADTIKVKQRAKKQNLSNSRQGSVDPGAQQFQMMPPASPSIANATPPPAPRKHKDILAKSSVQDTEEENKPV
jgi:hypothetical protein